ncbi:MAG: hypothetical protein MUF79_01230 [Burkholderiales bacterium]|jgi:hypothetical protein|nr:hypothetical protein [Burkholderiales bacterium]
MTESGSPPAVTRVLIGTRREYRDAFDALLGLARRELRIFDPDLVQLGLDDPGRIARLEGFLRATRGNRLFVAVHEPGHLERHSPRLAQLVAAFSTDFAVHRTTGEAARAQDCFVLADAAHVVRRAVAAHPRGVFVRDDPHESALMRERFDQIWESSEPTSPPTTLGL